jgi:hypothetical protein
VIHGITNARTHRMSVIDHPAGDTPMFAKTALAVALVIATVSSAFAGPKQYSSNPANDVFVNGKYVGSDPDPTIRSMLARDAGIE